MGKRLASAFRNELNILYTIDIHDSEWVDTDSKFLCGKSGFTLSYETAGDDILTTPIVASSVTIPIHISDNRSNIESFLDDLISSDEDRFTVLIYEGANIFWRGKIQTERVSIPDRKFTEISIYAADGIGRLKDMTYTNGEIFYYDWATVKDHVHNIIDKLDLFSILPGRELAFALNWYHTGMSGRAVESLRFQHDVMKEIKGTETFAFSCYDVLRQILTRFNARIIQSYGVFYIEQITHIAVSGVKSTNYYLSNGTYETTDSQSFDVTTLQKMAGGATYYREPAKKVQIQYAYKDSINGNLLGGNIVAYDTLFTDGYIPNANGEVIAFTTNYKFHNIYHVYPDYAYYRVRLKYMFRIGTYYLKNDNGYFEWTTDSANRVTILSQHSIDLNSDNTVIEEVGFICPVCPVDDIFYFQWENDFVATNDESIILTPDCEIYISSNIAKIYYGDNEVTEGTIVTTAYNGNKSGETIEPDTLLIGDLPLGGSVGRIQYYDGTDWKVTDSGWGYNVSESLNINNLLARETIALQKNATKIKNLKLRSAVNPAYKIDGNIITRAIYNAQANIWDIECFEPAIDRTGLTITNFVDYDSQNGTLPSGIVTPPAPVVSENYWQRTGTVLSPKTAGDKVEVTVTGANVAVKGVSESGFAAQFSSTYNNAGQFTSSTGKGLTATSSLSNAIEATVNASTTNTIHNVLSLIRTTSAAAANNIGNGISFIIKDSISTTTIQALFAAIMTNVLSSTSAFIWSLRNAGGALTEVMRLTGAGELITSKLSLGTSAAPTSTIQVNGSHTNSIIVQTGATLNVNDSMYVIICNTTSNAITINLPTAVGITGRTYVIRRYGGGNNVVIDPYSSETLLGSLSSYATLTLANNGEWVEIMSDGTNWYIVKDNPTF